MKYLTDFKDISKLCGKLNQSEAMGRELLAQLLYWSRLSRQYNLIYAHAHTSMVGMYKVAGVWGMTGLWKAAADICQLLCQDPNISSQAFVPLSLTHTLAHTPAYTLSLSCSFSLSLYPSHVITWVFLLHSFSPPLSLTSYVFSCTFTPRYCWQTYCNFTSMHTLTS